LEKTEMTRLKLRVGSILEIPLSDGRKAYGRYFHRDPKMGQILQVYDLFLKKDENLDLSLLKDTRDLFQPIFVGISGAVRARIWKIVGYLPVENFSYPGFLWPTWSGDPPTVYHWSFWDGTKSIKLGTKLPDEYKKYEYIGGYAAPDIAKRIETGEESFVKKLIAGEQKDEPG
jgi:hypothetical protein